MVAQKEKVKARFAGPSGPPCRCCIIAVVMAKAMLFVVATAGVTEGKRRFVERRELGGLGEIWAYALHEELGIQNFRTWSLLYALNHIKRTCCVEKR